VTDDAKQAARQAARQRRGARTPVARAAAGASLAAVAMAAPEVRDARVVAAYVGVGSEPPTLALLDALLAAGVRVLLPVVAAGRTLDWGGYSGESELVPVAGGGGLSLLEPAGTRLGPAALGSAAAVLVPALAVDRRGFRLGTGGGYYDRALGLVAPTVPVLAVVYDDELFDAVPSERHDRPVTGALTPSGVRRFH
jgi:5-formyltetrahydrofolate cyclo-ligase